MKRNYLCVAAGLGLAQLALPQSSALAQEQPLRSLDEVVVTASRSPKKQSEIGKVVHVITAEQLEQSQGRTLPDVLNLVPGLTIGGAGNSPGDIKSVYLRGASAGNTLILIDGVPVNDASNISGEFDISAIALDQVERIEVLKGGNSTLYGSDAIAGVINIITKKGYGKPAANLLATAGSYNTFKEAIGFAGQLHQTGIALNASNLDSRGFSTAAPRSSGGSALEKDGFHQKSLGLNLTQLMSSRWTLKGNLQYNNNEADLDNGAFSDVDNYTYDKESVFFGLGSRFELGRGHLNVNVSQNNLTNSFENNGAVTRNIGKITNADAVVDLPVTSFLGLTAGGTYKYSETDQSNPFSALTAKNNIASVFSSLFFTSKTGFNAELGGRLNSHSEFGENATFTINPSYTIAKRYKLFVNLSSAYKVPSLYQLYSEYGNLDLKPETSRTFEAGVDLGIQDNLNLRVAYFSRSIDDVIAFGQIAGSQFGYINQDEQNDEGYEVELVSNINPNIALTAFYAYVDGAITTPAGTAFNLLRRPKHTVGATAGIQLSSKVNLNLTYRWADKRQDAYYDESIPPFGETVQVSLDSYHLFDAYVQYKPIPRLTLFTDVKNLFDTDYTEFAGFNTRGTHFNAGLKIDLL